MERLQMLEEHLRTHPEDRFSRYALGLEYRKVGRLEEAERCLTELVERFPSSGAGFLQLGRVIQERGEMTRAADMWRSGLEILSGFDTPDVIRSRQEIASELQLLESMEDS